MKKANMAAVILLLSVLFNTLPALAEEDKGTNLDHAVQAALIVPRTAGAGTGIVVGAPVAVVRETIKSYISMTGTLADKVGSKDCAPSCLLVSLASAPGSLVVGTAKGLFYGTKNGVVNGFKSPFSRESLSLTKDLEKGD